MLRTAGLVVPLALADERLAGFPFGVRSARSAAAISASTSATGRRTTVPASSRHGGFHDLWALLVDGCQQRTVAEADGGRDRGERGFGLGEVGEVEQRADEQPVGAADEDAEGAAEDPDQQADEAAAGRAGERGRLERSSRAPAVLVTDHDDRLGHANAALRVELLQRAERRGTPSSSSKETAMTLWRSPPSATVLVPLSRSCR